MLLSRRVSTRLCVVLSSAVVLAIAGCNKKPTLPPPVATPPPPAAAKPTASITADKSTINPGESARLSWTTTDAQNVSIAPEVGAVTAQGNTAVTPAASTTYTLTATGPGGSTDATVRISINTPAPVETPTSSVDELFLKEVRDAYFDYDSAEIRADAQTALRKTSDFLKNYPQLRVTIEGHCDERGSTEYNLALGDRRANAVKQYLISLGVPGDRLNVVSFGKEKPFCMQASEECYAQNRRGHFVQAK
jgi:peptidoglycan-associated lipoprotein